MICVKSIDVGIVGGSFAGLSAAQSCASRGMKTVVFERKKDLGDQVRTTGILVKEADLLKNLPPQLTRKISGVKLYSPNFSSIELGMKGYYFLATNTPELMRWMGDQAVLAGAKVETSQLVREVSMKKKGVQVGDYKAGYLIGADGARSQIAMRLNLSQNKNFLLGAEAEYEGLEGLSKDHLHVFLDSHLAPGYIAWVVPGVGDVWQVGLACRKPAQPHLAQFIEKLQRIVSFKSARVVGRRGGLIPCGGVVKNWYHSHAMLLGDAAGMVSPLTAGGIHPSLELGQKMGPILESWFQGNVENPAQSLAPFVEKYHTKKVMRWGFDHFQPQGQVYDWALSQPWFRSVAQLVFFHHRGLQSKGAWKDCLHQCLHVPYHSACDLKNQY